MVMSEQTISFEGGAIFVQCSRLCKRVNNVKSSQRVCGLGLDFLALTLCIC